MNWLTEGPNGKPWYRSVRWTIIMVLVIAVWMVGASFVLDKVTGG